MRVAVLSDTHAPRHWQRCPPEVAEFDLDGRAVAMVHDGAPATARPARLRRMFPMLR